MTDPMVAEPGAPDDFWWYIVTEPEGGRVHLYEVGFPVIAQDKDGNRTATTLTERRQAEIHEELGVPPTNVWESGWDMILAPGRPNRWLEPKVRDEVTGELRRIKPKPGVTYHPLPGRGDPMEG